jgi:DNA-binding PadR family transcriptional regulator
MSSPELSLFSYEILGLVGRDGAGAHDLLRMAQRARVLDWAGESQYYTEPKRLAERGYLEARREPGRTRERTVYTLTQKGLDALGEYAKTPVRITPLKSDPLLRLLLCDLVGEPITRASLATLREDIADLSQRLEDGQAAARSLPHRSKYLLLINEFLRRYLELHVELVDQVERDFATEESDDGAADRDAAGRRRPDRNSAV